METCRAVRSAIPATLLCFALWSALLASPVTARNIDREAVEAAQLGDTRASGPSPAIVKAMVLLDRAGFSPGVIDGLEGDNFAKALRAFQREHGLDATGRLDETTWELLTEDDGSVLRRHTIERDDVEGPFLREVPDSLEEMAKLDRVSYTGPAEKLAERFHMGVELLRALNPDTPLDEAGADIVVADVDRAADARVVRIEVDKGERALRAYDESGELVAFYPATVGSDERPAPSGVYEVTAVAGEPNYTYRPDLDFEGAPDKTLVVPPGPNGPVGSTWIDLSKEGYGIHGTSDPAMVGKDFSHGCVRLTNWDAEHLARMVDKGTKVAFLD
jgi:lipoprotein-anchoring transpeptidase ErfK/SrfK